MMDICVNFRLGYFDSNGHEVMNPSKITKRYLKSWFPIDFMSSLPYDLWTLILGWVRRDGLGEREGGR